MENYIHLAVGKRFLCSSAAQVDQNAGEREMKDREKKKCC
jgi:hypothetical protein